LGVADVVLLPWFNRVTFGCFFVFLQEMHESKGKESMGKFDMGQWADTNEDTPI
jgi:hypothetical protein